MQRSDFHFELPDELIARFPPDTRGDSRLLCLKGADGTIEHRAFSSLLDLLQPNDLLVFNDTKVMPARLFGQKSSGGKIELLIERLIDDKLALAHMRSSRSPKPGARVWLGEGETQFEVEVTGRQGALFVVALCGEVTWLNVMDAVGHMPLPPYIDREDQTLDQDRYQTVYAKNLGAVAAPTAGLHFNDEMMAALKAKGVDQGYVTLHVGAGTFQPVKVDDILEHQMHSEYVELDETLCQQVRKAKAAGARVIAVGTTSVRCLETASRGGDIAPFQGDTDIFIYPGYTFNCIDALITNFHLPESTLIMLVSALAGYDNTMAAYKAAVEEQYRFFSYGDAMFVEPLDAGRAD
jgi:S-adenosylmethionine:tRNA ribosyltransferase-isomerase